MLVASDAIGMGLNLAIKRIIFSTVEKFDGRIKRQLTPAVSFLVAFYLIIFTCTIIDMKCMRTNI